MTTQFSEPETIGPEKALKLSSLLMSMILFVPLVLITWVLASDILGAVGVPLAWLVGIPVAAVFSGAMLKLRSSQLDRQIGAMSLTLSSSGITQKEASYTRFVAWDALHQARMVKPIVGMSTGKIGRSASSSTRGVDALSNAAAGPEFGLVGLGTLTMSPEITSVQKETLRQNETVNGVDETTGQPYIALYPRQFQLRWPKQRIGEWLAHYRPDLAAVAAAYQEQEDQKQQTPEQ